MRAGKPGAPITLSIEPQGEVKRGATGEFVVVATALTDSHDFSLDVDLPEGLALYSGDLHQQGSVRAGTQFRLTFSIRVPEAGAHEITATARLRLAAGGFEVHASYPIGTDSKPARSDTGVSTERNGEAVREYRLP